MSPLVVRVVERRGIRQRFHVVISSATNGKTLFSSENLKSRTYADTLAEEFATRLDAQVVLEAWDGGQR